jgi:hypothetical protein
VPRTPHPLHATDIEVTAICEIAKAVMWVIFIIQWLNFKVVLPVPIYTDSESTYNQLMREEPTQATRYYLNRVLAIRSWIRMGYIKAVHVKGTNNPADGLTRGNESTVFNFHTADLLGKGYGDYEAKLSSEN